MKRLWFPLALAALAALLAPAAVLFGVSLAGREADANAWLEERFRLSYHLPVPWWAGLALFLVPPLLVLLYFLKLRRKPLQVPSTFLWKKSIEDLHVNSLFQWLRNNVLLLLQLLAAAALIYAALGPRLHGDRGAGRHYILLIDNSASMAATDVGPSRLDWAKAEALKLIDAAGDDDAGMVLVFNSSAETRQPYTTNKGLLRQAVQGVEPTQRPTRIEEALTLADSLANPTRSTENEAVRPADVEPGKDRTYVAPEGVPTTLHLFSDGRFPDAPEFAPGNLELRYHAAGKQGPANTDNLAVVTLSASRDESDQSKLNVFVRILNFRDKAVTGKLQLEVLTGGRLQKVYEKAVPMVGRKVEPLPDGAGVKDTPGEGAATFELADLDDRQDVVLHAKLVAAADVLPADDEAWLVVGVPRRARVLIVGPPNPVLRAFFEDETTRQVADVVTAAPSEIADEAKYRGPARDGTFDLVIFDRCAPESADDLPRSNTLFVGAVPPPWKRPQLETVANPFVKGWTNQAGVLRGLSGLHEVAIGEAFRVTDLPPKTPRLMEGERGLALMFALSRGAFTDVVMAFNLVDDQGKWNTLWPLSPSFPLFLRNVLFVLGNLSESAAAESVQPGQVKVLRPGAGVTEVKVFPPSGLPVALERGSRAEFAFGRTDRLGVYDAEWKGERHSFAVNLLDPDESNVEPRPTVRIGAEPVADESETRKQPRELWKWAVALGLAVVMLEWWVYNRRVRV